MSKKVFLKSQFRYDLINLRNVINDVLEMEKDGTLGVRSSNLFPYLFRVYSHLWCKSSDSMFKKV